VLDGGSRNWSGSANCRSPTRTCRPRSACGTSRSRCPTPSGTGYYRYGNSAAQGSADGYGDCYQPSQTSCPTVGAPWAPTGTGTGHLWPVLSGERAESDVAGGNMSGAASLLSAMENFSSGVGLVSQRPGPWWPRWPRPSSAPPPASYAGISNRRKFSWAMAAQCFLGFLMATLALKLRLDHASSLATWLAPVLILGATIFDTTLVTHPPALAAACFRSPRREKTIPRIAWPTWAWASAAQS